jgi:hypothetical protein
MSSFQREEVDNLDVVEVDVQVLKLHTTVKSVEPRGGSSVVEVCYCFSVFSFFNVTYLLSAIARKWIDCSFRRCG